MKSTVGACRKRTLFDRLRKDLLATGLVTEDDQSLICPLCWCETAYGGLTVEHITPVSVGGNRTSLACQRCNNTHGSRLDSHLANFQKAYDALRGIGSLRATLVVKKNEVSCDWLRLPEKHSNDLRVVGKASNPADVQSIRDRLREGSAAQMKLTVPFGCSDGGFRTSLLRSGYLVLFHHFGYSYAILPPVQAVRQQIANPDRPHSNIGKLVAIDVNLDRSFDAPYAIMPARIGTIQHFQVLIRCRGGTTTYHCVAMPGWQCANVDFLSEFVRFTERNPRVTLSGKFFSPEPGY